MLCAVEPRSPEAHAGLAWAAYLAGDDEEAMVSANRALELDPSAAEPLRVRGQVRLRRGDVPGALGDLEEAKHRASLDLEVSLPLAIARARSGDADGAEAELGALLERRPNDARALFVLANVRYAEGEVEAARGLVGRALRSRPDFPEARALLERLVASNP
jgi:tetratricopeptide (TPR) repeat protein